eukprot:scaffold223227_cov19-Prasinocladus_malaysianus.AAC.1
MGEAKLPKVTPSHNNKFHIVTQLLRTFGWIDDDETAYNIMTQMIVPTAAEFTTTTTNSMIQHDKAVSLAAV